MKIKINFFKEKVLLSALLISLVWHVFWLSMVNVSVVPKTNKQIKFSGVSFLGPILDRGALKLSVEPHERTILESRYLENIGILQPDVANRVSYADYAHKAVSEGIYSVDDELFTGLTTAAIDTQKIEPGRDID